MQSNRLALNLVVLSFATTAGFVILPNSSNALCNQTGCQTRCHETNIWCDYYSASWERWEDVTTTAGYACAKSGGGTTNADSHIAFDIYDACSPECNDTTRIVPAVDSDGGMYVSTESADVPTNCNGGGG